MLLFSRQFQSGDDVRESFNRRITFQKLLGNMT